MKKDMSFLRSVVARRIYSLFIVCALLPVCALTIISLAQVSGTMQRGSLERLRHTSKNAGMTIVEGLFLLETEIQSLANAMAYAPAAGIAVHATQGDEVDERRFLAITVFSRGKTGKTLMGTPCPRPKSDPGSRHHLADGKVLLFSDPVATDGGRMFMASALERDKGAGGLLVVEINQTYLWTLVRHTLPPETDLCVIDSSGRPLFSSSTTASRVIPRVMAELKNSSVGHFEWRGKGGKALVNYWSVFLPPLYHTNSWTVVASQDKVDALRPILIFGRTFLLVICLTLIIVGYLGSIQIKRNLIPLATLRKGAQHLSEGDLSARVTLRSGDEFEELADTFNGMADHLQRQFTSLLESGRILQMFLAAHDRSTIVRVALSAQGSALPCDVMSLSLLDPVTADLAVTYRIRPDDAASGRIRENVTTFVKDELLLMDINTRYLHYSDTNAFSSLLAPLAEGGGRDFYLFPLFIKGSIAGIFTIGYQHAPPQLREDLARARQITDEIAVALDNIRLVEELNQLNLGTIRALANAVDAKSPWTAGHSDRVTRLSLEIGRVMGLTERDLELLHLGGMFHDIGKIAVPEAILDKNGALSDEEYALIKTHAAAGARILEPIRAYERVIPMVAQHHECFDGRGYPAGLAGNRITMGGRILAVADVFDALFSDRPYRAGWDRDRVLAHIKEKAGSQFDPEVVKALFIVIADTSHGPGVWESHFPPGQEVHQI